MCMWEVKLSKESHGLKTRNLSRENTYRERCMVHTSKESKFYFIFLYSRVSLKYKKGQRKLLT